MNKPLLFGFIGILVVVLGFPLLAQVMKGGSSSGATSAGTTGSTTSQSSSSYSEPALIGGPALDANSIVGTSWRVDTDRGAVTATFNPGGVVTAQHALAGTISGSWQLSGSQVKIQATAFGQSVNIPLQISGGSLLFEGKPVQRLN